MKKQVLSRILICAVAFSALFVQSCRDVQPEASLANAHSFDNKVYLKWNDLFLQVDRYAKGYRPGPTPRALGYLGLSAYEIAVPGIPENNSLENMFAGLALPEPQADVEYHFPAAINESYYYLMRRFFYHMESDTKLEARSAFEQIDRLHTELYEAYKAEADPAVFERSIAWGQSVAQAVYEFESTDAYGHNAFLDPQPTSYVPPAAPGLWQPTFPDYGRAVFPYWGKVRTFALRDADKIGRKPIPYSENPESLFYTQGEEVYNTVNFINNPGTNPDDIELARDLKAIAFFWSDDILNLTFSPPARLVAIANQIIKAEDSDLAESAELYGKMGLALSDCGVAIWNTKYIYNVERPASYIRRVMPQQFPDASNWKSILINTNNGVEGITPAFPAYPSGHSGFGGCGSKILSAFFEYNAKHPGTYTFTDGCHQGRTDFFGSDARTYSSFAQAGAQNALSRIPLGVHFRMDCDEGVRMGEVAAQRVLELPWKK